MEIKASSFKLRANAPKGQKRFPISTILLANLSLMIARIISLAFAWLGWGAMVVSDAYYVLTAAQPKPPERVSSDGDWIFPAMLLGASVLVVGWTVLLRWIYKRVLFGKRLSPDSVWSYVLLPVFGMLIWAPCGAVAVYGLIAFFSTGSFVWFFAFIAISCALLIIHMPLFLDPRRQRSADVATRTSIAP